MALPFGQQMEETFGGSGNVEDEETKPKDIKRGIKRPAAAKAKTQPKAQPKTAGPAMKRPAAATQAIDEGNSGDFEANNGEEEGGEGADHDMFGEQGDEDEGEPQPEVDHALPEGPRSVSEGFNWQQRLLNIFVGKNVDLWQKLSLTKWYFTTAFSGMGCPEQALKVLTFETFRELGHGDLAGELELKNLGPVIRWGPAIDFDKSCQGVLLGNFDDRCVFSDILDLKNGKRKFGARSPAELLKDTLFCLKHKCECPIFKSFPGYINVMCAGPPCPPWSTMGKKEGLNDPRAETHNVWAGLVRKVGYNLVVFENVGGYPTEYLEKLLPEFEFKMMAHDPKLLGYNMSRERLWAIGINKNNMKWTAGIEDSTLEDMVSKSKAKPAMPLKDFFFLSSADLHRLHGNWFRPEASPKEVLSASEYKYFQSYKASDKWKDKQLWDLTQNAAANRGRGVRSDGSLPTFLLNSGRLWCNGLGRLMMPEEMLGAMGMLATGVQVPRAEGGIDGVYPRTSFVSASYAAKTSMSGNGMHVPTAGLFLLTLMLNTERK